MGGLPPPRKADQDRLDATLAVLEWLGLVSARFWPILMTALQGAALLAHAAAELTIPGSDRAYAITEVAPSFAMASLLILVIR